MQGVLLVDKPKTWTNFFTETNLRFFSSRQAALFPLQRRRQIR